VPEVLEGPASGESAGESPGSNNRFPDIRSSSRRRDTLDLLMSAKKSPSPLIGLPTIIGIADRSGERASGLMHFESLHWPGSSQYKPVQHLRVSFSLFIFLSVGIVLKFSCLTHINQIAIDASLS